MAENHVSWPLEDMRVMYHGGATQNRTETSALQRQCAGRYHYSPIFLVRPVGIEPTPPMLEPSCTVRYTKDAYSCRLLTPHNFIFVIQFFAAESTVLPHPRIFTV